MAAVTEQIQPVLIAAFKERYSREIQLAQARINRSIKDRLAAMPEHRREFADKAVRRVLERFYRVLGSDIEGSGLGLAIVKEIATQHGGKLEILENVYQESPLKYGTCMRVYLPVGTP